MDIVERLREHHARSSIDHNFKWTREEVMKAVDEVDQERTNRQEERKERMREEIRSGKRKLTRWNRHLVE